jgi:hypothetical protein
MDRQLEAEVFACYWLLAMAPVWTSTLYTFSEAVYRELRGATEADELMRVAVDVMVREQQEPEYRIPDPAMRPDPRRVRDLGVDPVDAEHVVDAVGVGAQRLLTNDLRLCKRSPAISDRWGLRIQRPSEFLVEAVRSRAPWTTLAPWPWESLERIKRGVATGRTP